MQSLTVQELGMQYMQKCFSYYSENCAYFLFYAFALLVISIWGTRKEKQVFLPSAVFLLLTVFNPVFPVLINHFFDINKEYYRFFWIPPVVILVSYLAAKVTCAQRGIRKYITVALVILMFVGSGTFVYADGYVKSPNIYKMPTEIPEISEMIHEDSKVEYPRAIFEYDFNMLMRQYDAQILLAADREAYINAVSGTLTMDTILAQEHYENRLLAVVALNIEIDSKEFLKGLDETNTEYVIVSTVSPINEYLENAGLTLVGLTENHSVYHYQLKNETVFELPDYTDVWENY